MNCDDPPGLAWTQQDLYIPQPTNCHQTRLPKPLFTEVMILTKKTQVQDKPIKY